MIKNPLVYAIDFGTSNSLLAAAEKDRVHAPIPLDANAQDPSVLRSLLYFPDMSRCYYGADAITEFRLHQGRGRLIRSIKKYLPMRSFIGTWIEDRPANLEDIIGFFLREMRERANKHFQRDVDVTVMGRPARFSPNDDEDKFAQFRLEQAAKKAGFKEILFCPEPVAAAFDFKSQLTEDKIVLVADFGGGTSDFTVIRIGPGVHRPEDVLSIGGVALAGDILDGAIMRNKLARYFGSDVAYSVPFSSNVLRMPAHLMEKICSPADVSLLAQRDAFEFLKKVKQWSLTQNDKTKLDRLFCLIDDQLGFPVFEAIETSKRGLSEAAKTMISYHYPGVDIEEPMARTEFETFIATPVEKIMKSLDDTVQAAGITHDKIDLVCCTGGTARVPLLNEELVRRFGAGKLQGRSYFHSVTQGLAERAKQLIVEGK